jgi:hypothetical protein
VKNNSTLSYLQEVERREINVEKEILDIEFKICIIWLMMMMIQRFSKQERTI